MGDVNREIKFRIFDDNEMFYWGIGDVNGDGSSCTFPGGHLIKLHQMQYTGLKDKNGVEIYEGDIIESTNYDAYEVKWVEYIGEENFGDGIGYTGWNIDLCCGYPPIKQELKVLGNIYENKELLNG